MRLLVVVAFILATCIPAHAYIDPGSGSYIMQIAAGGILAIAFTIKLYWNKVRAFVGSLFGSRGTSRSGT